MIHYKRRLTQLDGKRGLTYMDGKDCSRQSRCISTIPGGHCKVREQGCGSFTYMDVGKVREQGCGSFDWHFFRGNSNNSLVLTGLSA